MKCHNVGVDLHLVPETQKTDKLNSKGRADFCAKKKNSRLDMTTNPEIFDIDGCSFYNTHVA